MSKLDMLTPENSALALIDYQPAMYQGVQSHDRLVVMNNIQVLAKAAKLFNIPTVISTVAADSFSGPFMPEVTEGERVWEGGTQTPGTSLGESGSILFRDECNGSA